MGDDPRIALLSRLTNSGAYSGQIVHALDGEDPLRRALREPSDELIDQIIKTTGIAMFLASPRYNLRVLLKVFADAVAEEAQDAE